MEQNGAASNNKKAEMNRATVIPHALNLPWKLYPFPTEFDLPLPLGWSAIPSNGPNGIFAPLLYHHQPIIYLQPIFQAIDFNSIYTRVQSNFSNTTSLPIPQAWFSSEFVVGLMTATIILQELLATPFWPGIDACATNMEQRNSKLPTIEQLRNLHRSQAARPLESRFPIDRFRVQDGALYASAIFEAAICYLFCNFGHDVSYANPMAILFENFVNTNATDYLRSIKKNLSDLQYLTPYGVYFEIAPNATDASERLQKLRSHLFLLNMFEVADPNSAHFIVPIKNIDGIDITQDNHISGSLQDRMMNGSIRFSVPSMVQTIGLDQPLSVTRCLDGGLTQSMDGFVYHSVGTPPSWDMIKDGTLDACITSIAPHPLPEIMALMTVGCQIRLTESFILVSGECNEIMNPADFRDETDEIRIWAKACDEKAIKTALAPAIPPELLGFVPDLCANSATPVSPVSCWLDIAIGPSIAAPAHAQIVRFSKEIEQLCSFPDVAQMVGGYALPQLQDAVGQTHKSQQIAQHLAQWLVYGLSHPTEHELIAIAPDPIAQHATLQKTAQMNNTPSTTADIHPSVLVPWKQHYTQLRNALESMLVKIAGPQAIDVLRQSQHVVESQQLAAKQHPQGGVPTAAAGPTAQSTTASKLNQEYFHRMDAENRMMSLATLYLDVPRRTVDAFTPEFHLQNAPVISCEKNYSLGDAKLPITIPRDLIPQKYDFRNIGSLRGVWGRPDCAGCSDAIGPLIELIDPQCTATKVTVDQLLEGQRRLLQSKHQNGGNQDLNERPDLCTLKAADWYKCGIISNCEWDEMGDLLNGLPSRALQRTMKVYVETYMKKHDSTEDDAKRAMFEKLGAARPEWRDYLRVRDGIVRYYREDPKRYLTVSDCRRQIWGSSVIVMKIFAFLEFYGLINLQATVVPGGVKGAHFRPLAQSISRYSSLRSPPSDSFLSETHKLHALFCEGCKRIQLGRVLRPRNTEGCKLIWCVECVASGRFDRKFAVEDFVPFQINIARASAVEALSVMLSGWTIDELEILLTAVSRWNKDDLLDVNFWEWVSSYLELCRQTGEFDVQGDYMGGESDPQSNDQFCNEVRGVLSGELFNYDDCSNKKPVYCLLAFLSSSRVTSNNKIQ